MWDMDVVFVLHVGRRRALARGCTHGWSRVRIWCTPSFSAITQEILSTCDDEEKFVFVVCLPSHIPLFYTLGVLEVSCDTIQTIFLLYLLCCRLCSASLDYTITNAIVFLSRVLPYKKRVVNLHV